MESIRQIVARLMPDEDRALFDVFHSVLGMKRHPVPPKILVLDESARERYRQKHCSRPVPAFRVPSLDSAC
ncbi:MAG: hypothetical protein IT168_23220 [Bryobacterales bacterium]|nr:hypothetical protein [Bryobacterales bacterium]